MEMIELNEIEKVFILAIKRHFHKYLHDPKIVDHSWNNYLQPLYMFFYNKMTYVTQEEYNYHIFKIIMDIYLKIGVDNSGCNHNLYSIFTAAFTEKSWRYSEATPIERVISQVCGLIQSTSVFEDKTGARFDLTVSEERKEEIGKGLLEEIRYRKEELYLEGLEEQTFNKGDVILFFRWCEEQGKVVLSEKLQGTLDNFGDTQLSFNLFLELIEEHLEDEFYYRGVLIEYFRNIFQETNPKFEDKEIGKEETKTYEHEDQEEIEETEPVEPTFILKPDIEIIESPSREITKPTNWGTVEFQVTTETRELLVSQVQEYGVESGLYADITKFVDEKIINGAFETTQLNTNDEN